MAFIMHLTLIAQITLGTLAFMEKQELFCFELSEYWSVHPDTQEYFRVFYR